jgi:uncharacterized integral membrane protein (TIGR00698 family)
MNGAEQRAIEVTPLNFFGWQEFFKKEDWWAIWLGLGIVLAGCALFAGGGSLKWLAVTPAKWDTPAQLGADLSANYLRYGAQFLFWVALFSVALKTLGYRLSEFNAGFLFVYVISVAIFAIGQWTQANKYNLEPPLIALVLGLLLSNVIGLPRWLDAAFRVEFYVKTGIVLLGATLPFMLILWGGPVAIVQAAIVSIITFVVIFWTSRRLGLDPQLAATLGAGGAVCGVSAAIAVAGAVGAKKEYAPIAITAVIIWAIVMIFVLPFASQLLHLPAGVAGAWIGTSEFADAAGFAAAQSYASLPGNVPGISGDGEQTLWAFTLMKVVGRDFWIGVWAFVLAVISVTRWEVRDANGRADLGQIWWRFPKFILGFIIASLLITLISSGQSLSQYNHSTGPLLVSPIKDLRTWVFIFCFLSIGLTTRFRDLARAGRQPFTAFSVGVLVNVVLGFLLSAYVFAEHWNNLHQ